MSIDEMRTPNVFLILCFMATCFCLCLWFAIGWHVVGDYVFLFDVGLVALFGLITILFALWDNPALVRLRLSFRSMSMIMAFVASVMFVLTRPYYHVTADSQVTISVRVTDALSGRPIKDSVVRILKERRTIQQTQTDANGWASFVLPIELTTRHAVTFTQTRTDPLGLSVGAEGYQEKRCALDVLNAKATYRLGSYLRYDLQQMDLRVHVPLRPVPTADITINRMQPIDNTGTNDDKEAGTLKLYEIRNVCVFASASVPSWWRSPY